eukprot:11181934-Lingulodinium_polyedra.AAC.1
MSTQQPHLSNFCFVYTPATRLCHVCQRADDRSRSAHCHDTHHLNQQRGRILAQSYVLLHPCCRMYRVARSTAHCIARRTALRNVLLSITAWTTGDGR